MLPALTACSMSSSTGVGGRSGTVAAPTTGSARPAASSGTSARSGASPSSAAGGTRPPAHVDFKACALLPADVAAGVLAVGSVQGATDPREVPSGVLRQEDGCSYTVPGTAETLGYLVWRYPSGAAATQPLTALQAFTRSGGVTVFRPNLADGSLGIVSNTGSVAAVQLTVVAGDRVAQLTLGGQPSAATAQDRATAAARQLLRRL